MTDINDYVATYVKLRDEIKEIEKRHKEELRPYREGLETIEGLLMKALHEAGADSMKTPSGTAYKQAWSSAKVQDWQRVLDYAVENERFDLFERRVSKAVAEEIGEVPGLVFERGVKVNVRRS